MRELDKHGFSNLPVLFLCSKFPFLSYLKSTGAKLSPAEEEYLEFTSLKFKLLKYKSLTSQVLSWEEILNLSGFDDLKSSLYKLLTVDRARAVFQKGLSDLQMAGVEIRNYFQSQAALVERGQGGNLKLIDKINESRSMVQYERRQFEKEIQIEIGNLQGRVDRWIAPFLEHPNKRNPGLFKDIALYLKHTEEELDRIKAKEKACNNGELITGNGQFEFFGKTVTIRRFGDEIEMAARKVFQFIDNFWLIENLDNVKSRMDKTDSDEDPIDHALAEMRDLFLTQLSEQCHRLLAEPINGVHKDIRKIYQNACENTQSRISGLTEELVAKLNNILNITFQPVKVEAVDESLNKIFETFDRLKNLGKASGFWENLFDWFVQNTKIVDDPADELNRKRIERICNDLKKYLSEHLIIPIIRDVAYYIQEVLANMKSVLCKELDLRIDEIRSHSIEEKFGTTHKEIEQNIREALERQPEIELLKSRQGEILDKGIRNLDKELRIYLYPRDN